MRHILVRNFFIHPKNSPKTGAKSSVSHTAANCKCPMGARGNSKSCGKTNCATKTHQKQRYQPKPSLSLTFSALGASSSISNLSSTLPSMSSSSLSSWPCLRRACKHVDFDSHTRAEIATTTSVLGCVCNRGCQLDFLGGYGEYTTMFRHTYRLLWSFLAARH